MTTYRWAIPLDDDLHARLTEELHALGTVESDAAGARLVFRDRFVALKVASALGAPSPVPHAAAPAPRMLAAS